MVSSRGSRVNSRIYLASVEATSERVKRLPVATRGSGITGCDEVLSFSGSLYPQVLSPFPLLETGPILFVVDRDDFAVASRVPLVHVRSDIFTSGEHLLR